ANCERHGSRRIGESSLLHDDLISTHTKERKTKAAFPIRLRSVDKICIELPRHDLRARNGRAAWVGYTSADACVIDRLLRRRETTSTRKRRDEMEPHLPS